MSDKNRLMALRKKLSRVQPENDLESLAGPGATPEVALEGMTTEAAVDPGLEVFRSGQADSEASALRKLQNGEFEQITAREEFQLEAIVERETRPVAYVRDTTFDPLPEPWLSFNQSGDGTPRDLISRVIPSVGRIEIPPTNSQSAIHAGTGFIVGDNLLMTNRHVAALFVVGAGQGTPQLSYVPGIERAVDYRSEYQTDAVERMQLTEIVMVHPYWDMAIFRTNGLPDGASPLKLSVAAPEDLLDRQVAVLGYPARYKNPTATEAELQQKHYQGVYGVKRIAPGEILGRSEVKSYGHDVNAMTHDSSTLPGNSGSAIIDVTNGEIIGLHFAGWTLKENYSVPLFELARDRRVVDLGLSFTSSIPATNDWESYWQAVGGSPEDSLTAPPTGSPSPANSSTSQTWTIPIQVTVSLGDQTAESQIKITQQGSATISSPDRPTPTPTGTGEPMFHGQEGWFGGSDDQTVEKAYARFNKSSLDNADFDWQTAISTAAASELAYANSDKVRSIAQGWNLSNVRFIAANGTECFVASAPNTIFVAFRGTAGWGDWVTDFKFIKRSMPYGSVHLGFQSAFQFVKQTIEDEIARIGIEGRELVLTGHSLGGALATIAAAEWHHVYPIRSIYTYGQPRVGNKDFQAYANVHFASKFYRFVNEDDVVTRVPSGRSHVGKLFHFDGGGDVSHESAVASSGDLEIMSDEEFNLAKIQLNAMKAHTQRGFATAESALQEGLISQFTNHSLAKYLAKIMQQL